MSRDSSNFVPAEFFYLRTPFLPADKFFAVCEEYGSEAFCEWVWQTYCGNGEVREAIVLSSSALFEAAESQRASGKAEEGIARSLAKYIARMSTRATPFNLLAGCTFGLFSRQTQVTLAPRSHYRKVTTVDCEWLAKSVADVVASNVGVQMDLDFRPNQTLYRSGGRIRIIRRSADGGQDQYSLTAIEPTAYLEAALASAANGAKQERIASELTATFDVDVSEALAFVRKMVELQLLVADIEPSVTTPGILPELVERLSACAALRTTVDSLSALASAMRDLDGAAIGSGFPHHREIRTAAQHIGGRGNIEDLLHVDLFKPALAATLNGVVASEIARAVSVLEKATRPPDLAELSEFRRRFADHYGDRDVPLLEALDDEQGIGFGTSARERAAIIDGLELRQIPEIIEEKSSRFPPMLSEAILAAIRTRADEIVLSDDDVRSLPEPSRAMSDEFSVLATVRAASPAAVDRGDFRVVVKSVWGPNSAALLGRFCSGDDVLRTRVMAELDREQRENSAEVFAEIVHRPAGRIANAACRPVLRMYEIPVLGRSGAPEDQQIPLHDLSVSVINDRVELLSERLGRRVVPRLANAHNPMSNRNVSIYRFLCAIQEQECRETIGWSWGEFDSAGFLPSVRVGRAIISRARWRVAGKTLRVWRTKGIASVREWCRNACVPRFVSLGDADRELTLDLEKEVFLDALLRVARNENYVVLYELPAGPAELLVTSAEGRFSHEVVVPMKRFDNRLHPRRSRAVGAPITWKPKSPVSDWVYAKYYAGQATAERLLLNVIAPLAAKSCHEGAVDCFFFVRYWDPEPHLRIRLHLRNERSRCTIFNTIGSTLDAALESKEIWRFQFDTYDPEVSRYGGSETIALSEKIFHEDTRAVVQLLGTSLADGEERWMYGLAAINALFAAFRFSTGEKLSLARAYADSLLRSARSTKAARAQLAKTSREVRGRVARIVNDRDLAKEDVLRAWFAAIEPVAQHFVRLSRTNRLTRTVDEIALSLAHMFLNRLLRSDHRPHELVIFDFLAQQYAEQARRR